MECRRGLATRILSVRPSVTRVNCDKTEGRSVQIYIPYERTFSLVFEKKNGWWGATPSTWNFGSTDIHVRYPNDEYKNVIINTQLSLSTYFPINI